MEQEDQLLVLARQFVELKAPFADADYKEQIALEVKDKIEETIRTELVAAMTPEQTDAYAEMLEGDDVDDDKIIGFINKCGIDTNEVTQIALTKFRIAYLGA